MSVWQHVQLVHLSKSVPVIRLQVAGPMSNQIKPTNQPLTGMGQLNLFGFGLVWFGFLVCCCCCCLISFDFFLDFFLVCVCHFSCLTPQKQDHYVLGDACQTF